MVSPDPARLSDAQTRIRTGFRVHALASEPRACSVQLAGRLATVYDDVDGPVFRELERGAGLSQVNGHINTDELQTLRKIAEIIEDDLLIDVGHSKLVRAASMASSFTSLGSFLIAGYGVLLTADRLDTAAAEAQSVMQIDGARFVDFYRSLGLFIAEGILFWTPLNFNFAWQGTRYLNNRFLYRFRELNSGLYRLLLSEIHYVIRGIVPKALRNPEEFIAYLSSVTMQTVEIIRDFDNMGFSDLLEQTQTEVREFQVFATDMYDIDVGDVDLGSIAMDVVKQLLSGFDSRSLYNPASGLV